MTETPGLTSEQVADWTDYFHARDCRFSHEDQCGWEHENSRSYPADARKWAHELWERRVPILLAQEAARVRQMAEIMRAEEWHALRAAAERADANYDEQGS